MRKELYFIQKKSDCCGCTACESVCPVQAVSMKPDSEGFLYPSVDSELCISCGLCETVCPVLCRTNKTFPDEMKNIQKYAVKNKDNKVRMASTSGAVYTVLSDYVLDKGGVVYGSVLDSEWEVRYIKITNKEQRNLSRGAKYVQSRLDRTYTLIKSDLAEGRLVLFTGPPCYTDGLRQFLKYSGGKSRGILLTADMVCHGAPSPLMWKEQVSFLKGKYKSPWKNYLFRDKRFGWRGAHNTIVFENGTEVSGGKEMNAFTSLYFEGYISRPACHECIYTNLYRPGDLTIGDCWGIEECHEDFDDGMGISLVMANTGAGVRIFEKLKDKFDFIPLEEQYCVQPQLKKPAEKSAGREALWSLYEKKGYKACIKKYTEYRSIRPFIFKIKKRLFRTVKKIICMILNIGEKQT